MILRERFWFLSVSTISLAKFSPISWRDREAFGLIPGVDTLFIGGDDCDRVSPRTPHSCLFPLKPLVVSTETGVPSFV